ncbi:hypothetical protein KP509_21G009200 [Ceratopteris richardii]|nr:hypothetical protein KP509_21G009200 [Ceratopteris richardii]
MSSPLSNYYIFTGHNSYLTGNQLSSESSIEAIVEALERGVRVVELDLWPDDDGDIRVLHGRTLTSSVKFEVCLSAIKENAFIRSQYPVIITLEDHLSPDLQVKAAKIIKNILVPLLYCPPSSCDLTRFPSPKDLEGKILISTKPPKEINRKSDTNKEDSASGEENTTYKESYADKFKPPEQENSLHFAEEYMNLIAIRQGSKGKSLSETLKIENHAKRVSLSERKLSKLAAEDPLSIVKFTQNNILRIYPRGLRVDSSNYNPMKAWLLGAQMVALNMQGYGKHLWVAQGFFRANGCCGYVKKPDFLLSEDLTKAYDLYNSENVELPVKQTLKINVFLGRGWHEQLGEHSFDKRSAPDFFVKVGIAGAKVDKQKHETNVKKNDWEPIWNEEFEFMLRVPELAILRIEVQEHNKTLDVFAGQVCLPVSELKAGYRVVTLCDNKGEEWETVKLLFFIKFS